VGRVVNLIGEITGQEVGALFLLERLELRLEVHEIILLLPEDRLLVCHFLRYTSAFNMTTLPLTF